MNQHRPYAKLFLKLPERAKHESKEKAENVVYAGKDDFLVLVKSAEAATRMLASLTRFKQRVREITLRNRGHRELDIVAELRCYATGWISYFGISHAYTVVVELAEWIRRRVWLY